MFLFISRELPKGFYIGGIDLENTEGVSLSAQVELMAFDGSRGTVDWPFWTQWQNKLPRKMY